MTRWPLYPVLYMALLAAVFGTAVSGVAVATRDRVEAGERARLRGQVLAAFDVPVPEGATAIEALWRRSVREGQDDQGTYYTVRTAEGRIRGLGFPFRGPGFWGPIEGILAVDPSGETILGLSFVRHQETPGLGGRISESWFREQFRGKPTTPDAQGGPALHFVYRKPADPREVEAITGATQTSSRLDRFLNRFLSEVRERPALRAGGAG